MSTNPPNAGWTAGRVLGFALGLIGLIGFGSCSLLALLAVSVGELWSLLFTFLPAVLLAWLCYLLMATMARRARGTNLSGQPAPESNWTVAKVVGLILALLFLVGIVVLTFLG